MSNEFFLIPRDKLSQGVVNLNRSDINQVFPDHPASATNFSVLLTFDTGDKKVFTLRQNQTVEEGNLHINPNSIPEGSFAASVTLARDEDLAEIESGSNNNKAQQQDQSAATSGKSADNDKSGSSNNKSQNNTQDTLDHSDDEDETVRPRFTRSSLYSRKRPVVSPQSSENLSTTTPNKNNSSTTMLSTTTNPSSSVKKAEDKPSSLSSTQTMTQEANNNNDTNNTTKNETTPTSPKPQSTLPARSVTASLYRRKRLLDVDSDTTPTQPNNHIGSNTNNNNSGSTPTVTFSQPTTAHKPRFIPQGAISAALEEMMEQSQSGGQKRPLQPPVTVRRTRILDSDEEGYVPPTKPSAAPPPQPPSSREMSDEMVDVENDTKKVNENKMLQSQTTTSTKQSPTTTSTTTTTTTTTSQNKDKPANTNRQNGPAGGDDDDEDDYKEERGRQLKRTKTAVALQAYKWDFDNEEEDDDDDNGHNNNNKKNQNNLNTKDKTMNDDENNNNNNKNKNAQNKLQPHDLVHIGLNRSGGDEDDEKNKENINRSASRDLAHNLSRFNTAISGVGSDRKMQLEAALDDFFRDLDPHHDSHGHGGDDGMGDLDGIVGAIVNNNNNNNNNNTNNNNNNNASNSSNVSRSASNPNNSNNNNNNSAQQQAAPSPAAPQPAAAPVVAAQPPAAAPPAAPQAPKEPCAMVMFTGMDCEDPLCEQGHDICFDHLFEHCSASCNKIHLSPDVKQTWITSHAAIVAQERPLAHQRALQSNRQRVLDRERDDFIEQQLQNGVDPDQLIREIVFTHNPNTHALSAVATRPDDTTFNLPCQLTGSRHNKVLFRDQYHDYFGWMPHSHVAQGFTVDLSRFTNVVVDNSPAPPAAAVVAPAAAAAAPVVAAAQPAAAANANNNNNGLFGNNNNNRNNRRIPDHRLLDLLADIVDIVDNLTPAERAAATAAVATGNIDATALRRVIQDLEDDYDSEDDDSDYGHHDDDSDDDIDMFHRDRHHLHHHSEDESSDDDGMMMGFMDSDDDSDEYSENDADRPDDRLEALRGRLGLRYDQAVTVEHLSRYMMLQTVKESDTAILNTADDGVKCICFGDYEVGDEVAMLPCFHRFHQDCLNEWFKSQHNLSASVSCPSCRARILQAAEQSNNR